MPRTMKVFGVALFLLSLLAVPILAQVQPAEEEVQVIYQKTTVLEYQPGEVTGKIPAPSAVYGVVKAEAKFDLTIQVRKSFLPEVMMTAGNL